MTEDCSSDPNNGSAICTCKSGYTSNSTGHCIGMNKYIN